MPSLAAAPELAQTAPAPALPRERLMSVDALRGFIMFWILGADALFAGLGKLFPTGPLHALSLQLDHVEWEGLRFYDLIFPTFIYIIGVSICFSVDKMVALGGRGAATRRILRRGVLLYLLGVFYYGGFSGPYEQIRLLGVLQRLAICYTAAALLYCWCRPRTLVAVCGILLVGYWALLTFVPVPGVGAGNFAEGKNLANYVDRVYLPLRKWDGDHDPEGLLSTLPAIATCLLGVFAGLALRNPALSPRERIRRFVMCGFVLVLAGFAWNPWLPIIKKIWTSSYVLAAAGFSTLFLAFFYWMIDLRQTRRWAMPFVWIGMNAIVAYMIDNLVDFGKLGARFFGGELKDQINAATHAGVAEMLIAAAGLACAFAIMRFLYERRVFLRL